MLVRKAARFDAPRICALLNRYPQEAALLARPQSEVCSAIDSFLVAEGDDGRLLGCCALHRYDEQLAEVRSIVVRAEAKGCGIGGALMEGLLAEARGLAIPRVCLFTRVPGFFRRYGFLTSSISNFPQKQASDCVHCSRRGCCDEVAMEWSESQASDAYFPLLTSQGASADLVLV